MSRWVLAALLAMSGCAFALDGPDPNRPRNRVPVCDTSKGPVFVDGLMATALGVVTLAVLSANEPEAALLPLALGALYTGGALSGNRAVDECRKAHDEYGLSYAREQLADQRPPLPDESGDKDPPPPRRPQPPQPQPAYVPPPAQQPQLQPPQPAQPAPPAAKRPAPKGDDGDDWSDFWREVP